VQEPVSRDRRVGRLSTLRTRICSSNQLLLKPSLLPRPRRRLLRLDHLPQARTICRLPPDSLLRQTLFDNLTPQEERTVQFHLLQDQLRDLVTSTHRRFKIDLSPRQHLRRTSNLRLNTPLRLPLVRENLIPRLDL
jgi:hypothetical protein